MCFLMAGLDANRIFEVYTQDTGVKTYLIGYTGPGVTFFTNAPDKSLSTTASYQDIDISSNTGTDTAVGAIFTVTDSSASIYQYALRKKGSSDDLYWRIRPDTSTMFMIGVDGSELAEMKIENAAVDLHLTGYVTSGAVFFTDAVAKATATTAEYVDVDITADLLGSDVANGAILEIHDNGVSSNYAAALRPNGASYDYYADIRHSGAITAIDANDIFEQKIENTSVDLYLLGYTLACVGGTTLADHAAGQEPDRLEADSSVTGEEFFAFQLTNSSGSTVTLNGVEFQLSSINGMLQGDFDNFYIYVDADGSGDIEGGETRPPRCAPPKPRRPYPALPARSP
jgi:hypothetical protein